MDKSIELESEELTSNVDYDWNHVQRGARETVDALFPDEPRYVTARFDSQCYAEHLICCAKASVYGAKVFRHRFDPPPQRQPLPEPAPAQRQPVPEPAPAQAPAPMKAVQDKTGLLRKLVVYFVRGCLILALGYGLFFKVIQPIYYELIPFSQTEKNELVAQAGRILAARYLDSSFPEIPSELTRSSIDGFQRDLAHHELKIQILAPRFEQAINSSLIILIVNQPVPEVEQFDAGLRTVRLYRAIGTDEMARKIADYYTVLFKGN
jgi:hypothetical protein